MFSQTDLTSRRKFLERSLLGFGSALFLPGLLASCTDHNITPVDPTPIGGLPVTPMVFTVTNHTDNQPFIILLAWPEEDNPGAKYYERYLQAARNGGGGGDIVVWQPGETKQCTIELYDGLQFIVATPDFLFPMQVIAAHDQYNKQTNSLDPLEVSDNGNRVNIYSMRKAEQFLMLMKAFPDTDLVKGFRALLTTLTDSSLSTDDIEKAQQDFFSNTDAYQLIDLQMLSVLSTYHHRYPYVWSSYQLGQAYYLYSSDGDSVTYRGAVVIAIQVGRLGFNVDDPEASASITYTDEHNQTKTLYYDDGFFVDDLYADNPAVCLVGNFVQKSWLTNNAADTQVIPIPIGVINGVTVLGTDQKPAEKHSWFYILTHPQTAMDWINIIFLICGAMIGLEAILLAGIGLFINLDNDLKTRDQSQADGSLAQYIAQANQDRAARLAKHRNTPIPVDTTIEIVAAAMPL